MKTEPRGFSGYSHESFAFLHALSLNNSRDWFEAHRTLYEQTILEPSLALIRAMAPVIADLSPHYTALDKRVGGSLMRIHRDTRFGADKTPYKTNVGIQFRHEQAKDVHAPAWYFHLEPGNCFVGAGSWHPDPESLLSYRTAIASRPEQYRAVLEESTRPGGMDIYEGESLKRVPRGFDPDHPLARELRRQDFLLSVEMDPELYLGPGLVDELASRFRAVAPWMRFLCGALGVGF